MTTAKTDKKKDSGTCLRGGSIKLHNCMFNATGDKTHAEHEEQIT